MKIDNKKVFEKFDPFKHYLPDKKSMDQQKRENLEEPPVFSTRGTMTTTDMTFYLLNSAIGSGSLGFGSIFHSGLIFSYILLLIFGALAFVSTRLYVLAAARYRQSTFEEIWTSAFGKSTVVIPLLCTIVSSICNIMSYTQFAENALIKIISTIIIMIKDDSSHAVEDLESHSFLIGLVVCLLYYVPFSFTKQVGILTILSYTNVITFLIFVVYVIARCIIGLSDKGFDPDKQFHLFNLDEDVMSSLSSTIFSFLLYPIAFPGLRHARNSSPTNLKRIFARVMAILFFMYVVLGTFGYLTFYGQDTDDVILEYYSTSSQSDKILRVIGYFLALIYVCCTAPICINVCRYVTMTLIQSINAYTLDIWYLLGITYSFVAVAVSGLDDEYLDIIFLIADLMAACFQYIFPAVLYLRGYKLSQKIDFTLAVISLIVGVGCIAFTIYQQIFP